MSLFTSGDDLSALVFDAGSGVFKAGRAGDDTPAVLFPSVVGTLEQAEAERHASGSISGSISGSGSGSGGGGRGAKRRRQRRQVGFEELNKPRKECELRSPFKRGLVEDWDLLEDLWSHSLARLGADESSPGPFVVTEPSFNSVRNREKLCELAFERFGAPAVYIAKTSVLSCFAVGRQSGLIVESGAQTSSVCPVLDGYALEDLCVVSPIAGDMVTAQLLDLIEDRHGVLVRPRHTFRRTVTNFDDTYGAMQLVAQRRARVEKAKAEAEAAKAAAAAAKARADAEAARAPGGASAAAAAAAAASAAEDAAAAREEVAAALAEQSGEWRKGGGGGGAGGAGGAGSGTDAGSGSRRAHQPTQFKTVAIDRRAFTNSFNTWHRLEVARRVKEELCRVTEMRFSEESMINVQRAPYELPDGQRLLVGSERLVLVLRLGSGFNWRCRALSLGRSLGRPLLSNALPVRRPFHSPDSKPRKSCSSRGKTSPASTLRRLVPCPFKRWSQCLRTRAPQAVRRSRR